MISNSLGAMPRQTARNLAEYADTWATRGVRAWEERWWEMPLEIGNKIARDHRRAGRHRQHARERDDGAHGRAVLACGRPPRRKRIVCSAMDFPSMVYLYRAQEAAGFELRVVPGEDDLSVSIPSACSTPSTTRTAVVAFSHVLFRTSYIMDAAAIARRARASRARRSSSTPISRPASCRSTSRALDVDFAVGGCLKWLCGGPGNAFLYTRPELLKTARPSFTGWLSRAAPVRVRHRRRRPCATTRCG